MKKLLRQFRHGQRGFTLIELLIVVAILGIMAAVLVPNVSGFLSTGNLAAANTEAATVKTAASAYYADHDGAWPANSDALYPDYLDRAPVADYTFDTTSGLILTGTAPGGKWEDFVFVPATQQWEKLPSG